MIDTSVQTNVRSKPILPLTTSLGPVHLAVTDRQKALAIWQDVVGLDLISESANALSLGAGGKTLIVLETGAVRPVVQRSIGLYPEMSAMPCLMQAQPQIAAWAETHPGLRVARFHCRDSTTRITKA